jgi:hypothetical protein
MALKRKTYVFKATRQLFLCNMTNYYFMTSDYIKRIHEPNRNGHFIRSWMRWYVNTQGNAHTEFRLTNSLVMTSWSRLFLGKLTGSLLIRKFPAFYGTRSFITAFTSVRYLSMYWATVILSMTPSYFLKVYCIIFLPSTTKFSNWSILFTPLSSRFS